MIEPDKGKETTPKPIESLEATTLLHPISSMEPDLILVNDNAHSSDLGKHILSENDDPSRDQEDFLTNPMATDDELNTDQSTREQIDTEEESKMPEVKSHHNYNLRSRDKIPEIVENQSKNSKEKNAAVNRTSIRDLGENSMQPNDFIANASDKIPSISDLPEIRAISNNGEVEDEKAASALENLFSSMEQTNQDGSSDNHLKVDQVQADEKEPEIGFIGMAFPLRAEDRDDGADVDYDDHLGAGGQSKGCDNIQCDLLAPKSRWKTSKNANRNVDLEYVANDDYWTFDKLSDLPEAARKTGKPLKFELAFRTRHHRNHVSNSAKPTRRRLLEKHRVLSSSREAMGVYVGERERLHMMRTGAERPLAQMEHTQIERKSSRSRKLLLRLKQGVGKIAKRSKRRLKRLSKLHHKRPRN